MEKHPLPALHVSKAKKIKVTLEEAMVGESQDHTGIQGLTGKPQRTKKNCLIHGNGLLQLKDTD